ncbi:MAG: hypothetical protein ACRD2G_04210 [Terriglobia bacterium]
MFRMRIRMAVGRLLNDQGISDALRAGREEIERGIMPRCVDYDKEFKLRRLGLNADQRAVAALYIYSKEIKSAQYARLESAVRRYAANNGLGSPFAKVDSHITWVGGHMTWTH